MPYRTSSRDDLDVPPPPSPRRRFGPVSVLVGSAVAHLAVLGAFALLHRDPPPPTESIVRVLTTVAEVNGDDTRLTLTGVHRARVRIGPSPSTSR